MEAIIYIELDGVDIRQSGGSGRTARNDAADTGIYAVVAGHGSACNGVVLPKSMKRTPSMEVTFRPKASSLSVL